MSARRQSSTTSLSRYARANSPDLSNRSLDFCNAFWGAGDAGVDVLFARMRGAARTIEELRMFWKERAAIEEDYAKRLAKLAKQTLGRDEIGELKNSLDTLRLETDRQAIAHANLAQQVRSELESPAGAFAARQAQFKRGAQSIVEKAFKNKQTQESYVTKAREKYEADCMRINSYTAQSTLVQGKDLEKIQVKLDRARQTVTANERDFANFARALQGTVEKWEKDWKAFCDACQDLEEERIEFMKDNVWAYANAVSTVCVSDDESCEKIRLSLEQLEPDRDMENFVRDYGTGNEIPDPPRFVSYTNPESASSASSRQTARYANHPRASMRHLSMGEAMRAAPPDGEPTDPGLAGFGAPARNGDLESDRSNVTAVPGQARSVASSSPVNGTAASGPTSPSSGPGRFQSQSQPRSATGGPLAATSDPSGPAQKTMLAVGGGVYEVNPDKDPQNAPSTGPASPTGPSTNSRVGGGDDPLLRQMAELRSSAAAGGGSIRRNSVNVQRPQSGYQSTSPAPSAGGAAPTSSATGPSSSALAASAPSSAAPNTNVVNRDYRNSAEIVVGGPPPTSVSRPTSPAAAGPSPPVAAHMMPPAQVSSSNLPIEEVVSSYAPPLPGERRKSRTPVSRGNSPATAGSAISHAPSQSLGQGINTTGSVGGSGRPSLERPKSREGYAGIGSGGRSPSPGPAPAPGPSGAYVNGSHSRTQSQNAYRLPSPGPGGLGPDLGISLDASGQVTHDLMADQYRRPPPQSQQPQVPPPGPGPQGVRTQYGGGAPQRSASVQMTSPTHVGPPPPQQYGGQYAPGPTSSHIQRQPPYAQPPPPTQPQSAAGVQRQQSVWYHQQVPPVPQQQPPAPPTQQQPQQYIPPPPQQSVLTYGMNGGSASSLQRGPSVSMHAQANSNGNGPGTGYSAQSRSSTWYSDANPIPQQQQQQQQQYGHPQQSYQQPYQQQQAYGGTIRRSPSPQPPPNVPPAPTGQYINGKPILFYVKALYDYQATIDEEFDFQTGDIIAVTSTPEDGWWTGELLDDSRRVPGRTVFPSNFVCLF
ncbi:HOF1 [Sanghuangporus sanghuang]